MPERIAPKASFHEEAEKDFLEASEEYRAESDELAEEFEAEVEHCVELIVQHPQIAPAIGRKSKNVRGKVLARFPYGLFLDRPTWEKR